MVEHEFPITLGRDYAGVVEQVGADVTRFSVGDEVFGFIDEPDCARRHLDRAHRRPRERVDRSQARKRGARTAAAAPLTAITAMSAIDALAIGQGDTLLVIGATPAGSAASPSSSPPPQARP